MQGDAATALGASPKVAGENRSGRIESIQEHIQHATHLLPTQTPIRVFVHHNTLHAFEDLPFAEAVARGSRTYGCHPYLTEDRYRHLVAHGRILPDDLARVLLDDLGDEADHLVGYLGTRYNLRLAMLEQPLRLGPEAELRWVIAETDALRRFRPETPAEVRDQVLSETRHWVMRDVIPGGKLSGEPVFERSLRRFNGRKIEEWTAATWEAFTLELLWNVCREGVTATAPVQEPPPRASRPRDWLLSATGVDIDGLVNESMIRFCAAFLDQGMAHWPLPGREQGFFASWRSLYQSARPIEAWLFHLPAELGRIERLGLTPLEIIADVLDSLGIGPDEEEEFLTGTLLALRGWAGMVWQMETNAEWAVHPAPAGTLVEYIAVRLILERCAIAHVLGTAPSETGNLRGWRTRLPAPRVSPTAGQVDRLAFLIFQLAQVRGWTPETVYRMSAAHWRRLVEEIARFSSQERRRIYHLAYERRYRIQTLDAILAHAPRAAAPREPAEFQVVCCIDEREESFRRHLEEVAPRVETFGIAGFFAIAMYYKGVTDAHYVPLCPVVIKPEHYVQEEVVYSFESSHRRRAEIRKALGKARHWLHAGSRSAVAGALSAGLGTAASIPLIARVLFPRLTARVGRLFGSFVQPPPITRLLLERIQESPGPEPGHLGYSVQEMIGIARRVLEDMGLTQRFSRLVIVLGHGSSSLNNPHESAHDCGACGGGRGGPNARALAMILNDPRIREKLFEEGLCIPRATVFIGGYHNTCDDQVEYYDLDRLPSSHHREFELARESIDEARRRNAQERCRRFESAALTLSPEAALRHVEARAEDLSQVRPEYGHATNAICFVGRRARTRGLFMDRRCFLTSYNPLRDPDSQPVLTRILQAVIPVCAGINLEYYFSVVDPNGYGCGTKLPHNITSLVGVMDGAASDLRPGLPWQMVEIHEPVRILFVIETRPEFLTGIFERNPPLKNLVDNEWVQVATIDPDRPAIQLYQRGQFRRYEPESRILPWAPSSHDWFRGWREHLGYASIGSADPASGSRPS